jgi:hypothetical protein
MQHFCTCDKIRAENVCIFFHWEYIPTTTLSSLHAALGAKMKANTERKSQLEIL